MYVEIPMKIIKNGIEIIHFFAFISIPSMNSATIMFIIAKIAVIFIALPVA